MTRVAKFGKIKARDCRLLAIRIPADAVARLEAASRDGSATKLLFRMAMAIAGGDYVSEAERTAKRKLCARAHRFAKVIDRLLICPDVSAENIRSEFRYSTLNGAKRAITHAKKSLKKAQP